MRVDGSVAINQKRLGLDWKVLRYLHEIDPSFQDPRDDRCNRVERVDSLKKPYYY